MDMEKYSNGKLYLFFEWLYKLIVWNLLTFILTILPLIVPLLMCYVKIPENAKTFDEILAVTQAYPMYFTIVGILLVIGLILAVVIFIPSYCTIFTLIKAQYEGGTGNVILTYFEVVWKNFKELFRLELIIIPVVILFGFAMYVYYVLMGQEGFEYNAITVWYNIGYNVLMVCLFIIFLCFLNLPMVISNFKMKTRTIMKFTLIITFKQIINTLFYLLLFVMPILLMLIMPATLPFYVLFGFSLPLYIMYFLSAKKYRELVKNIETIKDDDIYEFGGKNETRN